MRSEQSIEIGKPIEEVFDVTVNRVPEWSVIVVEDEMIDEKPGGVGSTFRVVTEDHGRRMEFDGLVTVHQPPTAHTVEMKGRQFDIEAAYRFEDLSGRTRVTQVSTVHPKGVFKVMFALFGWMMRKSSCEAQARELASLKQLAEGQAG